MPEETHNEKICKDCPHRLELLVANFEDTMFVCLFCERIRETESKHGF